DAVAEPEAEAGPALARGEERLEDGPEEVAGDAGPRVLDAHDDLVAAQARRERDPAHRAARADHRLARVPREVDEDLLPARDVERGGGDARVEVAHHL